MELKSRLIESLLCAVIFCTAVIGLYNLTKYMDKINQKLTDTSIERHMNVWVSEDDEYEALYSTGEVMNEIISMEKNIDIYINGSRINRTNIDYLQGYFEEGVDSAKNTLSLKSKYSKTFIYDENGNLDAIQYIYKGTER